MLSQNQQDIFCLTDIAKFKNPEHPDDVIRNWLRSRSTVEFLGLWERLNNPSFNPVEFDWIRMQTGLNSFVLTPKQWIEKTRAVGITSSAGRYGGTYANKDIAFEFASWVSVEFKLYLIREFQRLKDEENDRLQLGWNLQRTLAKINYRIHTEAIKETLVPPTITKTLATRVYADEADLLKVALFGQTAKQWRNAHPDADGNIRDLRRSRLLYGVYPQLRESETPECQMMESLSPLLTPSYPDLIHPLGEFALGDLSNQVFGSRYTVELPRKKERERFIAQVGEEVAE